MIAVTTITGIGYGDSKSASDRPLRDRSPRRCGRRNLRTLFYKKHLYQDTFILLSQSDYSGISSEQMQCESRRMAAAFADYSPGT